MSRTKHGRLVNHVLTDLFTGDDTRNIFDESFGPFFLLVYFLKCIMVENIALWVIRQYECY